MASIQEIEKKLAGSNTPFIEGDAPSKLDSEAFDKVDESKLDSK